VELTIITPFHTPQTVQFVSTYTERTTTASPQFPSVVEQAPVLGAPPARASRGTPLCQPSSPRWMPLASTGAPAKLAVHFRSKSSANTTLPTHHPRATPRQKGKMQKSAALSRTPMIDDVNCHAWNSLRESRCIVPFPGRGICAWPPALALMNLKALSRSPILASHFAFQRRLLSRRRAPGGAARPSISTSSSTLPERPVLSVSAAPTDSFFASLCSRRGVPI